MQFDLPSHFKLLGFFFWAKPGSYFEKGKGRRKEKREKAECCFGRESKASNAMKSMRRSRRGGRFCLSVLLLLLMMLMVMQMGNNTTCCGFGHQKKKINRLLKGTTGTGSSNSDHYKLPRVHPVKSKGARGGEGGGGDDDIFGAEKRKIHTGPNPLHNR